ncbi:MAG: hypothetical protein JXA21_02085 [Anaerolineae bacterium]|nr:hypothetical protein [Anaerolineae bacterium]
MRRILILLLCGTLLLPMFGCKRDTPTPTQSPLPSPEALISPLAVQSPLSEPESPTPELAPPVLNAPIYEGDTVVTGSGPAGLPIRFYDVGQTGKLLGSGVVAEDGTFSVTLAEAVYVGQRVALMQGDLEGTPFTEDQLIKFAITYLPNQGLLFSDVAVQAK